MSMLYVFLLGVPIILLAVHMLVVLGQPSVEGRSQHRRGRPLNERTVVTRR